MGKHRRRDEYRTQTSDLVRRLSDDVQYRSRRRRKQRKRLLGRFLRAGLLMMFVTFVVIPSMIAGGFLLGPRGVEGLIAAPLLLFLSYAGILYWTFKGKSEQAAPALPALPKASEIAQLPAQTDDWLEQQRTFLPYAAQKQLDSIAQRLETLNPQVQKLDPNQPVAGELRRLLGEELPELVQAYRKVPNALQQKPLHDGPSPERQLLDGLATIDEQIGRMHERLAADDLHALATHQRYLDLKYKRDDELK
jgi:hypothetical protein